MEELRNPADDRREDRRDDVVVDAAALAAELAEEHPADIAEALDEEEPEVASAVLASLPRERQVEVLDLPDFDLSSDLIEALPVEEAVRIVSEMSADRAADLFRWMDEPARSHLFARLPPETQAELNRLLSYPEHTAGSLMTTEFVTVPSTWTVGETLRHIREIERTRETIYAIYVLDPVSHKLVKAVTLRRLITGETGQPILSVAPKHDPITVDPLMDREDVARLISKYDLLAVPVVDQHEHVLGIVTVDDMIDAIIEEGTEDAQKFGGMEALDEPYMEIGFFEMLKKRAGWLSILFLGEMLTANAMQHFEDELERAIVLTLFIPLIMSSGGNSGSQATSLIIRALALGEIKLRDWWRVALRELPSGLALGSILAVLGVARITAWQLLGFYDYGEHWLLVAFAVGATLVAIVTFGSLVGSMLPFLLRRLGFDPASASAPFVATFVDVTGLVIYFSVALLILHGTLL
ncbi:magnesium transporter [Ancylobacter novellus DSM 506]|uniref:Magnesium transporter MgtE n=1 Tax=Ancylobacter novellus (strain ATCC 8093 / DSM 506 / JCM 20403 / CCM 1077 / IAM 12100 / NBRC 12443 / NCIMB 10456) TaxID=639283 RepID=D7A5G7_ANCN5|nr:magnesium transporter [Ancylobacter novellus]ADH88091.1 magnesium transporter [Ancylobacter novellus DSM 506]